MQKVSKEEFEKYVKRNNLKHIFHATGINFTLPDGRIRAMMRRAKGDKWNYYIYHPISCETWFLQL